MVEYVIILVPLLQVLGKFYLECLICAGVCGPLHSSQRAHHDDG